MDPNRCLRRIGEAVRALKKNPHDEDAHQERDDAERDLATWLSRGGFDPKWTIDPDGASRFADDYPSLRPATA